MIGIIVSAHDDLAESLVDTAAKILGPSQCVATINVPASAKPEELAEVFQKKMKEMQKQTKEILWLVDIFGGTPFTMAIQTIFDQEDQALLTGVNLPMLLQALTERTQDLEKLVDQLAREGKESIRIGKK